MATDVHIGPFRLVRPIASGGMGMVLHAVHRTHGHPVAVKVMTGEKSKEARFAQAFREEVRAVAKLDHPNVIRIFDSGEISEQAAALSDGWLVAGRPFLVMELAETTLSRVDREQITWRHVRTILVQILDALAHSHARGLVHRDLKPANVLFAADQSGTRLVLSDFGIAHAMDALDEERLETRHITGTPGYMAPEQIIGEPRDEGPWTDLYALGCLAYWLSGEGTPFSGNDVEEILRDHLHAARPDLEPTMEVPEGFEVWARRLLARDRRQRFQRAADAAVALSRLDDQEASTVVSLPTSAADESSELTVFDGGQTTRVLYDEMVLSDLSTRQQTVSGQAIAADELPDSWRYNERSQKPLELIGVGLGVFGLRHIPMVGREQERDILWRLLVDTCHSGHVHGAIIGGPAGIGKTRLANWLAERAHEVGAVQVLRASHSPISGGADGMSRMVANFLGCTGLGQSEILARIREFYGDDGDLDEVALHQRMALATLLARGEDPDFDEDSVTIQFSTPQDRFVVWKRLFEKLCEQRPLLLHLDDVHWGSDTLEFVRYLLNYGESGSLPIMVVMTARDEVIDEVPVARRILDELSSSPWVERLAVEPLERPAHQRLIHNLLGLESGIAQEVIQRTAGNPLFAIQLVGDWVERGVLELGEQGFGLVEGETAPLPENIHQLLVQRLTKIVGGQLDDNSNADLIVLELAATLGREVDEREWKAACDEAGIESFPATLLEVLAGQNLAKHTDQGWKFVHGALRETLQRIAEQSDRLQDHHRCCAQALEFIYGRAQKRIAPRIARHLLAAGDDEQALEPMRQAIDHYQLTCQFEASSRMARRYNTLRQRLGISDDDRRTVAGWLQEANLYVRMGKLDRAVELLLRCEAISEAQEWPDFLAQTLHDRTRIARLRGNLEEGFELGQRALALCEQLNERELAAWIKYQMGWLYRWCGELEMARQSVTAASKTFKAVEEIHGYPSTIALLGVINHGLENYDEARRLHEQCLELFDEIGDLAGVLDTLNNLGETARSQCQWERAEDYYRRVLSLSQRSGIDNVHLSHANLAWMLMEQGEFEGSVAHLEKAHEAILNSTRSGLAVVSQAGLLACMSYLKNWNAFDEYLQAVLSNRDETGLVDPDLALAFEWAADHCLAAGEAKRAKAVGAMALSQWEALGRSERAESLRARLPDD